MTVRIINADVLQGLAQLADESVHCVVTSPPYWGLRDYGTGQWIGGDPSCDHRSPTMRAGRNEERAKLSGSAATNSAQNILAHNSACGKCGAVKVDRQLGLEPTLAEHIAAMVAVFREVRRVLRKDGTLWLNYGDCYATSPNGRSAADTKAAGNDDRTFRDKPFSTIGGPLKSKDLCMIPHRLAIALQEDGWWVRADIVWAKPNPMPESIKDRPTKAHEYVFLLTKSERYWYDADAIREAASYDEPNSPASIKSPYGQGFTRNAIGKKGNAKTFRGGSYTNNAARNNSAPMARDSVGNGPNETLSRNKRSVWSIATAPFPEAHFATFPPELPKICIKAGCPVGGTVLDPFGGAGTTGLVADRLQRNAILIELNPEYAAMAERRISNDRGDILNVMEGAA